LYFFTNSFPFGGESFVANEIDALALYYEKIFLFSSSKGKEMKDKLPANVEVVQIEEGTFNKKKMLLLNAGLVLKIFMMDLSRNSDKKNFLKNFRYNLSLCLSTLQISERVKEIIQRDKSDKRFVSFWMDQWALCLSILKYKNVIKNFVFRVHQHDLYADNNPKRYIPFRYFNIKMASAVFPDSKRGVQFLKDLKFCPQKIQLGHLGVTDKGTNIFDNSNFVIVSCSALLARKRVDKIADVLKLVDIPVNWIHFGAYGDAPDSYEKLKKKCSELPGNIKVDLRGDVLYRELIDFYQSNSVNLFITLTRAEGLPVSVIEAVSFGIPVLATDVMGLPDVVTENSGILISPDEKNANIAALIKQFVSSEKNTGEYRKKVKDYWRTHFNSEVNYFNFNNYISSLN